MADVRILAEETLAAADDDRKDKQAELIDQVVPQESVDEIGTAVDQDRAARVGLQPRDGRPRIVRDERRAGPFDATEAARHDVFGHGVDPIADDVVADRRPERGPDLVGRPA